MTKPQDVRAAVLALVRRFPGLHVRAIERALGVSSSLAFYHLKALQSEGAIEAFALGGSVRYFPTEGAASGLADADRRALALLRDSENLRVVLFLLDNGPTLLRGIALGLDLPKSTLHYHLDKLVDARLVGRVGTGDETTYRIVREDKVRALLRTFRPTPDLIDRVGDLWDDFYGR